MNRYNYIKLYVLPPEQSYMLQETQIPIVYHDKMRDTKGKLRVFLQTAMVLHSRILLYLQTAYVLLDYTLNSMVDNVQ